jgi:hypothetical protein
LQKLFYNIKHTAVLCLYKGVIKTIEGGECANVDILRGQNAGYW